MPTKTDDLGSVGSTQTTQGSPSNLGGNTFNDTSSSGTQHPFTSSVVQDDSFQPNAAGPSVLTPPADLNPSVTPLNSQTISGDNPPSNNSDLKDFIVTSPHTPQKYGGKKVIATIFGILLLITSVATGVYFIRNQQLMVGQAWNCSLYVFEVSREGNITVRNGSSNNEPPQSAKVYINENLKTTLNVPALSSGTGMEIGTVDVPSVLGFTWRVVGTLDCQNNGSYSPLATPTPTPVPTVTPSTTPPASTPSPIPTLPPEVTAACGSVVAYDINWDVLSSSQLAALKAGDVVRFAVSGTTTNGSFDKARFTINGVLQTEVTTKKPGGNEFYQEYTIPNLTSAFSVSAQIYHSNLGWI